MASCLTPFTVKNKCTNDSIPVPCGKCPACLSRRVSGWSFRLMQEDRVSESSIFLTFTYDTLTVPITRNGFMTLNKRHVQLFMKRLRKECPGKILKYYVCGEYGGKTNRPHYHMILFNANIEKIQPAWALGSIHYGVVTGASVGYTLKYMSKLKKIPMHSNDDRQPEFALMSKGLGESYLSPKMVQWHKKDLDNRMYLNIENGKKISMPRYYKDKLYEEHERKRVAFFARQTMVKKQLEDMAKSGDQYFLDKANSDKAAFNRMYHRATTMRNKI